MFPFKVSGNWSNGENINQVSNCLIGDSSCIKIKDSKGSLVGLIASIIVIGAVVGLVVILFTKN